MIEFKVDKQSKKSRARLGVLNTPHGLVETPSLVAVATQAVVKTLTSEEAKETKTQILIANTFHLHLKPGAEIISSSGGLHQFMNWHKPLMTDSGGFQVFSLGFGLDQGVGKILKYFPGPNQLEFIQPKTQPKSVRISDDGVYFRSPLDGRQLFLGPKQSIKIQEKLGAEIIFAFDECTSPLSTRDYVEKSLKRTHRWAKICLRTKSSHQALFGIVQGSRFRQLREQSAQFINSLGFAGFGIGGDLGTTKKDMEQILNWTIPYLDERKPRHLLGIGYPEDMEMIVKNGIDLFDCTVPTHYARRGIAFVKNDKLNLKQAKFLVDKKPLDNQCACQVCQNYKRNYICHLLRANEMTAFKLLTFHNLYFFNTFVEKIRTQIKQGKL